MAEMPAWARLPWDVPPDAVVRVLITYRVPASKLCPVPPSGEPDPHDLRAGAHWWLHAVDPEARVLSWEIKED